MFWGLIMEPNKRYTQTVEKAFHLSMASLDASTAGVSLVQVMLCYDDRNYLLCTLQKGQIWQVPLDLNFQEGTKIAFTCNGEGHVHLTGYLIPEDDPMEDYDDMEDEEDEDEEIPQLVPAQKRKAKNSPQELKQLKKSKLEDDDDDEDDEDDEDSDDEENGILGTEEDSDDDEDDDEEEDEDSDDEDDSEDEDEEEEEVPPVQLSKKEKQKLKQLQKQQNQPQTQQNQQLNKKDKNKEKLANGTDAKPQKEQGKQKKNESKSEEKSEKQQKQPQKRKIEGGVTVEDLKVGSGAPAKAGKFVTMYYVGKLKNGKKFDATTNGEGFKFRLGKGEVIKGWDVGIAGMKVGGKRRVIIPPNMGYGNKGSPPVIPPNSELHFDVELKAVH